MDFDTRTERELPGAMRRVPHRWRSVGQAACLLAGLVGVLLGGCRSVETESIASWRQGVSAVQEQSAATFQTVNELVRKNQLARAGTLTKLTESDFSPGLDAESLARWDRALDDLAAYAASAEAVVDPKLAASVGESLKNAGERMAATARSPVFEKAPGLSKAMQGLGTQITAAVANHRTREIMLEADPAVQDVLRQMSLMIEDTSVPPAAVGAGEEGEPPAVPAIGPGVRMTVRAAWTIIALEPKKAFRGATDAGGKKAAAERYAEVLSQRDQADAGVVALKRAIESLGAAHTAAAQGRAADLSATLTMLRRHAAMAQELVSELKGLKKSGGTP